MMTNRKTRTQPKVAWEPVVWQPLRAMDTLPVAEVLAAVHQRLDRVYNHLSSAAYPHAERPGPLRPSNSPIVGKKSGA